MSDELQKAAADFEAHIAASTGDDAQALAIAFNAARGVLLDAEKAADMVAEARKIIRANSRPLSFVAAALHDIEDPKIKRKLWAEYTKLNSDDPDVAAFTKRLRLFAEVLKSHENKARSLAKDRAIWDAHYKSQGQRGPY
jgi:hypothetical protein